ncbi:hypothetical protein EUX98_g4949 [Antrodiella citrinella]|uniref:Major facilitator superfamily (MFS) profile domain-containing protein n=1 Tax=Antrodiella citrinella TaxID=2447956 RepID=A0A4V3XIH5_9APHY|nr:hypothetical protein EUX98_g4949 [Antrodiella citrinella]
MSSRLAKTDANGSDTTVNYQTTDVAHAEEDAEKGSSVPLQKPDDLKAVQQVDPANAWNLDPAFKVSIGPDEDPKHLSTLRKWSIVLLINAGALCVTSASSVAAFTEAPLSQRFHVGQEVPILSISLFVLGLGIGPLFVGPLSEVYGRNIVYRAALFFFWVFTWPVAFPPDIGTFLAFRFLTGVSGAAFLSVSGGSVADLFEGLKVPTPMACYTLSPFIGPTLGPLFSGFINQNSNWKWTYRIFLIWIFIEWIVIMLFVPETYHPVLLKWKAAKAAILLGILYLAFQAFPIIFGEVHRFNTQEQGLSFLGLGIGMVIALATQPLWNRLYVRQAKENGGVRPPECNLIMGQWGAILVPVSLYWLAFTTYKHIPWIVPMLASVPLGTGFFFCFTSIFTYLVTSYRPIAASAMAANTFMRATFAAAFPLFAGQMYGKLGTVGATALLAGLTTLTAPLPFIFYRIGARLRSKFHTAL